MQPAPDTLGEFKVVTNNMSAEYGRAAGATITVSCRSGTNALHGTGWEFMRDTSMNAAGFVKPTTGKPTLDRNQFGGVLDGPIVRNKAFFFADYEGLRQTRKSTGFASIATPARRQGIWRPPSAFLLGGHAVRVPAGGVQRPEPRELPRAQRQPQLGCVRHHHLHLRSAATPTRVQGAMVTSRLLPLLLMLTAPAAVVPPVP